MTKVSIVKCDSYDNEEVYDAVKKSIDLIGGLNIREESKVLIKPNILRPAHPNRNITTHPAVIRAIIKILKQKNCKIFVGDSPGFHNPLVSARVSGILDVCKEEGVSFVDFKDKKSYFVKDSAIIKRFDFAKIIDEVDYIINAPKLKTHVQMGITFAIKNTFGFMTGLNKSKLHLKLSDKEKFATMLVDIHKFINPTINIIDGVFGMEGDGPSNGKEKKAGIIAASYDALSLDIVMCKLVGFNPLDYLTNKVALRSKEEKFIENINIVGVKEINVPFEPANTISVGFGLPKPLRKIIHTLMISKPRINPKKCKACQECIKICPAKTIFMRTYKDKQVAWIKKENCIRCFCCHEICHYDAIDIKKSLVGELMERFHDLVTRAQ